jgi:hypothetical protein
VRSSASAAQPQRMSFNHLNIEYDICLGCYDCYLC